MRYQRPAVLTAGALALGLVAISATPSLAVANAKPVTGTATSEATLLKLSVLNHVLQTVSIANSTSTVGSVLSSLSVVPVTVDGVPYGKVTVTPADGSRTVAAPSVPSAVPANLAAVASPVLTIAATAPAAGPSAVAGATSLGSVQLLGLPVSLNGSLSKSAQDTVDSVATTGLKISNLALPSLKDLLKALGLDVTALPVTTLNGLLTQLHLPTSGLAAADAAVTSAQTAAGSTVDRLRDAQTLVSSTQATLTSATATFNALLATISPTTLLAAGLGAIPTISQFQALSAPIQTILTTAVPGLAAASTAYTAATTAVATATALVGALANLGSLVNGVLGATSLVSVGSLDVATTASAGQHLIGSVTGAVSGVKVLGTDVLKALTGNSTVDAAALVAQASALTSQLNTVTSALHTVLSTVPGLAALNVPAPTVALMQATHGTSMGKVNQTAFAALTALSISFPSFALPAAVALPGAGSLPGLSTLAGILQTPALGLTVGSISENALATQLVPASAANPTLTTTPAGAPTGALATTGLSTGVGLGALALIGLAFGVARIRRSASESS